jgi:hypothetical protein
VISTDFKLNEEDSENIIICKTNSDIDNFSIAFSIHCDVSKDIVSDKIFQRALAIFAKLFTDRNYTLHHYFSITLVSKLLTDENYYVEIDYIDTENADTLYLDGYCYNNKNQLVSKAGAILKIKN